MSLLAVCCREALPSATAGGPRTVPQVQANPTILACAAEVGQTERGGTEIQRKETQRKETQRTETQRKARGFARRSTGGTVPSQNNLDQCTRRKCLQSRRFHFLCSFLFCVSVVNPV